VDFAAGTFHTRQTVKHLAELRAQQIDIDPGLRKQMSSRATLLIEQGHHQVHGFYELMILAHGHRLRIGERHLKFACQFVHTHKLFSLAGLAPLYMRAAAEKSSNGRIN
jgi:hypothetical protein